MGFRKRARRKFLWDNCARLYGLGSYWALEYWSAGVLGVYDHYANIA